MIVFRYPAFILGVLVVVITMTSAVRTLILPRSAPDPISRGVFVFMRRLFNIRLRWAKTYAEMDSVLAFYAPVSLLMLLPSWLVLVLLGYTGMFWAIGAETWFEAFRVSGSSLLTLGFETQDSVTGILLIYSEAAIGLILIALIIAYLPTTYAAFSRRETAVTLLEVRAGSPPAATEMLKRFHRIHGLERLSDQWRAWETWFADIEESHTSLPALVFFRSPQPEHSWVTAAGAVLDTAALTLSAVEVANDPQAALCIRAGYLALRHIADFFGVRYNPIPNSNDPISISRQEFEQTLDDLAAEGVPLKTDREQAWLDFNGWRVNYDTVLLALASLTSAPLAPWSSDRAPSLRFPSIYAKTKKN